MGEAYFMVSMQLFHDILNLPDDVEIVGVTQEVREALMGYFRVYIKGENLPTTAECGAPAECTPLFREVVSKAVEFAGWSEDRQPEEECGERADRNCD